MINLFTQSLGRHAAATPPPVEDATLPWVAGGTIPFAQTSNLLQTNTGGHRDYVTFNHEFADQVYYDAKNDCTYLVYMQNTGGSTRADNVLVRYNHTAQAWDLWGMVNMQQYSATRDYHTHGVIARVGAELLFACEESHNGNIRILMTTNGDIRQLRDLGTLPRGGAYPKIYVKGQKVMIAYRGPEQSYSNTWCSVSEDGGESWADSYAITNMASVGGDRFYAAKPIQREGGTWHLQVSYRRDFTSGSSEYRYVEQYWLISEDGRTWRNVAGTFSKNVRPDTNTANPITRAELQQHFMFASVPYDNSQTVESHGACVLPTGQVFSLWGRTDQGDGSVYVSTFANGSWQHQPLALPAIGRQYAFYAYSPANWELIVSNPAGTLLQVLASQDAGQSWQVQRTIPNPNGNTYVPFGATNSAYGAKRMLCVGLRQGTTYANIQFEPLGNQIAT